MPNAGPGLVLASAEFIHEVGLIITKDQCLKYSLDLTKRNDLAEFSRCFCTSSWCEEGSPSGTCTGRVDSYENQLGINIMLPLQRYMRT
jgi:hypothetical protein